jgi:hypothetical protein
VGPRSLQPTDLRLQACLGLHPTVCFIGEHGPKGLVGVWAYSLAVFVTPADGRLGKLVSVPALLQVWSRGHVQ